MQQRARMGSAFGEGALQETREHGVDAAEAAQTGGYQRTGEGAVAAFQCFEARSGVQRVVEREAAIHHRHQQLGRRAPRAQGAAACV